MNLNSPPQPVHTYLMNAQQPRAPFFWPCVAAVTAFSAFVLPFLVPVGPRVMSQAYTGGANTRAGTIAVALVSLLVAAALFIWNLSPLARQQEDQPLDRRFLSAALLLSVLFTGVLGALVARTQVYWGDSGYFINRLRTGIELHQPLYTGFEFPYGPALYWWPAMFVHGLAGLGVSLTGSYMISLTLLQAIGMAFLFYCVNALPMRSRMKASAFVLLALCSLTPLLGINYSLLRFLVVPATLILLSRSRHPGTAATVAAAGEMIAMAVSPEVGLAFAAGAATFALHHAIRTSVRYLFVGFAALAGIGLFAAISGAEYFQTFTEFAKGGNNLLPVPLPHLVVFLVAAVALAPIAIAVSLRSKSPSVLLSSLFISSLGMLPGALGRSDPLHVFFNGIGFYLLSFVAADRASRLGGRVWVGCVAAAFLFTQTTNFHLYGGRLRGLVHAPSVDVDIAALRTSIGPARATLPIMVDGSVEQGLIQSRQYAPSFYCGNINMFDEASEQRQLRDMRAAEFTLIPKEGLLFTDQIDNQPAKTMLRFGYRYKQRNSPYASGLLIKGELETNWNKAGTFGAFVLWRHKPIH